MLVLRYSVLDEFLDQMRHDLEGQRFIDYPRFTLVSSPLPENDMMVRVRVEVGYLALHGRSDWDLPLGADRIPVLVRLSVALGSHMPGVGTKGQEMAQTRDEIRNAVIEVYGGDLLPGRYDVAGLA